ncbi:MAG: nitrate ABC transporter ATP-binding protein [Epulopiscium sp. Nele67-Bin004]|nr:MAG: nitrate ABC transporter ATP-binding protein [Epulopiscium sp. Nele67-Bin004]
MFAGKNISKKYDERQIIENINLEVAEGEIVALLGISGIGKTTLFNILSGLETPDSGSVLLKGKDITGVSGNVGYMQQKDLMLPYKKVIDNIALPLVIKKVPKQQAHDEVLRYAKVFGLTDAMYKYPHQLSGGMRQRSAFLRSFLFNSSVMLLDEPFSALDCITKGQIQAWFLDIVHTMNMTALLITHDIDEAILIADKIYIMAGEPGQLTECFDLTDIKIDKVDNFSTSDSFILKKREILKVL